MNKLLFSFLFLSPFFKFVFNLFFFTYGDDGVARAPADREPRPPCGICGGETARGAPAALRIGCCETADTGKKNTTKSACEGLVAPVVGARAVRGAPGRVAARSTSESLRSAGSGVAFGCWTRRAAAVAGRSAAERGSGRPAAGAPAGGRVPRPRGLGVETLAWFI